MAPRKGMLAFFLGSLGPHYSQTHPIRPGRNHFWPMVFEVVGSISVPSGISTSANLPK